MACQITITSVSPSGQPGQPLTAVVVEGTATECNSVTVKISCGGTEQPTQSVSVDAQGQWQAAFNDLAGTGCVCDDPNVALRVQAFCKAQASPGVRKFLEDDYPQIVKHYSREVDGHPMRVIEAVSEGVLLNSLEHSCRADYVSALRPRLLRKIDCFRAILVAFDHWGKPYDFNFDFVTDDKIVCSELVYKAYRPDGEKKGLTMTLQEKLGRKVLPSNEFIGVFRDGLGRDGLGRDDAQLGFVYFLKGIRKEGKAVSSSPRDLADSYTLPKWSMRQE